MGQCDKKSAQGRVHFDEPTGAPQLQHDHYVFHTQEGHTSGDQIVWRTDNETVDIDMNRLRARSAPMLAASKCVHRLIFQHVFTIYAQHLSSDVNTVDDLPSGREIGGVREEAMNNFDANNTILYFLADFSGWAEQVIDAGYQAAKRRARCHVIDSEFTRYCITLSYSPCLLINHIISHPYAAPLHY